MGNPRPALGATVLVPPPRVLWEATVRRAEDEVRAESTLRETMVSFQEGSQVHRRAGNPESTKGAVGQGMDGYQ